MELGLGGRVALVAASSKGLGRAVARGLAAEGAAVTVCARTAADVAAAAAAIQEETGARVLGLALDVSRPGAADELVGRTVAEFGALDILVNNAGGPPFGRFTAHDDMAWEAAVQLNLLSAVRLIRAALPHLGQRGAGRIVNIASWAVKQPIPNLILSNAVRLAVVGMAKTLADEVAGQGITVNTVGPGSIQTDRLLSQHRHLAQQNGTTLDQELARTAESIPLGRIGTPAEFADLVVFLASARAGYITGQTILSDGGAYRGSL